MTHPPDLDAMLDAASEAVGVPISEAHRDGVKQFLAVAAQMADILESVPLDDRELALAPVYTPPKTDPAP